MKTKLQKKENYFKVLSNHLKHSLSNNQHTTYEFELQRQSVRPTKTNIRLNSGFYKKKKKTKSQC